jgi:integrase
MDSFKNLIRDTIKENRPKLSESSIKTYISTLYNLHKNLNSSHSSNKSSVTLAFFNDEKPILDYLDDKPPQSRKSILSALYILTNNPKYREQMIVDCKVVNDEYKNQKKDTKERDNWISIDEIKSKYDELFKKVKAIFSKSMIADYSTIMDYFLLAFLGGVSGLAPRRSLDYALLKINNYDKTKDNYYKAGKLYFNKYKTKYGLQILEVPSELNGIIKKWLKINKGDYMLFSTNKNPLSSSQISRMLNKIFDGKKISVDMLRHIYLTDLYKNVPSIRDMEKTAQDMSHSVETAMTYIKRD